MHHSSNYSANVIPTLIYRNWDKTWILAGDYIFLIAQKKRKKKSSINAKVHFYNNLLLITERTKWMISTDLRYNLHSLPTFKCLTAD